MAFSRVGYFTRETFVSLSRNLMMSLACVITVAISLLLVGGALMYTRWVENGTERWQGNVAFEVFMNVDATNSQIDATRVALDNDPDIKSVKYLDKEAAYEEFKRYFRETPDLVESTEPEFLPASFRVTLRDAKDINAVSDRYAKRPGVDEVVSPKEAVQEEIRRAERTRWVLWGLATVLGISAVILVVFTVRLATLARKREIEVMKLVGASNWFVRIPFMAEGGLQGFGGALLAGLGTLAVARAIPAFANQPAGANTYFIDGGYVVAAVAGLGLAGIIVGIAAAFFGLYRYLDV